MDFHIITPGGMFYVTSTRGAARGVDPIPAAPPAKQNPLRKEDLSPELRGMESVT